MPLYLCEIGGTGRSLEDHGVDDPFLPAGAASARQVPQWLDLRPDASRAVGRGIIELPTRVVDPRLTLLGDDLDEVLAAAAKAAIERDLSVGGDALTLSRSGLSVRQAVVELLRDQGLPGARTRRIQPAVDGARRILLTGREVLVQPGPTVRHSQSHPESWPNNGTSLVQDRTWSEPGADMEVSGNRLRTDSTAAAIHNAVSASGDLDSANHRSSFSCAIASKAGTLQRLYMDARYTDNNNLYSARAGRETTNFRQLLKRVAAAQTVLGSDTTDPGATYTGEISVNGSTIKFVFDGSDLFSVTDVSITTGTQVSLVVITTAAVGDASYGAGVFEDIVATAAASRMALQGVG